MQLAVFRGTIVWLLFNQKQTVHAKNHETAHATLASELLCYDDDII